MKGAELDRLIDRFMLLDEERKLLQKQADNKKAEAERYYNEIILQMTNGGIQTYPGTHAICSMWQNVEPKAEDWPAIYKHIQETGEFELLHKRLTGSAIKERWDAGVEVPGVERYPVIKLTFKTKVV